MIINVYAAILLFIDLVSLALALALVGWTWRQLGRLAIRPDGEARERIERRATLLLLVATIVVGLRAVSWPWLYTTLESFVPTIEGAMCIYGVTQILPRLSRLVELTKPLVFLLAGGWLLLDRLDRRSATSPLARTNTRLLLAVAVTVSIECLLELALLSAIRPTFAVTCCTTVADVASRPTSTLPTRLLGPQFTPPLLAALAAVHVALLTITAAVGLPHPMPPRRPAHALLATAAVLALAEVGLAWVATIEVIAPAWMRLPLHHCAYCFLACRDAPLAVGVFLLGICLVCWAVLVDVAAAAEELQAPAARILRRLHFWAFVLLSAAGGMTLIHLIVR